MDSTEYVAQLAQFTSVEQAIQTNQKLDVLLASQSVSQAGALIGRNVTSADETVSGEVVSVQITSSGPNAVLADGRTVLVGPGVTIE